MIVSPPIFDTFQLSAWRRFRRNLHLVLWHFAWPSRYGPVSEGPGLFLVQRYQKLISRWHHVIYVSESSVQYNDQWISCGRFRGLTIFRHTPFAKDTFQNYLCRRYQCLSAHYLGWSRLDNSSSRSAMAAVYLTRHSCWNSNVFSGFAMLIDVELWRIGFETFNILYHLVNQEQFWKSSLLIGRSTIVHFH